MLKEPVPFIMKPSDKLIAPIRERRSIRAFTEQDVDLDTLELMLEAARWSASCFNEQPWRFLVIRKSDNSTAFDELASCINDENRPWAAEAPVLLLAVAKDRFTLFDEQNQYAWHDVGLAMGNLTIQGTELGLNMHQMAGILHDRIRKVYQLPVDYSPVSITAIGYPGNSSELDEPYRSKDAKPRERKPVSVLISPEAWRDTL